MPWTSATRAIPVGPRAPAAGDIFGRISASAIENGRSSSRWRSGSAEDVNLGDPAACDREADHRERLCLRRHDDSRRPGHGHKVREPGKSGEAEPRSVELQGHRTQEQPMSVVAHRPSVDLDRLLGCRGQRPMQARPATSLDRHPLPLPREERKHGFHHPGPSWRRSTRVDRRAPPRPRSPGSGWRRQCCPGPRCRDP
jgi:hypothetical protein